MKPKPFRRRSFALPTIGLVAACAAFAAATAQSAVASTLVGETFIATNSGIPGGPVITVSCGPTPQSPFTYHVEGAAIGPHEGSFVEDGTVVPDPVTGFLLSLDATFTITSLDGNVTGEKHLFAEPGTPTGSGICIGAPTGVGTAGTPDLCYRADFADGSSEVGRSSLTLTGSTVPSFTEEFFVDLTTCGGGDGCPPGDDDDNDGLNNTAELGLGLLVNTADSNGDGITDGDDDANGNGEDDEDEDDGDECPDEDSDGDGEDDEDEDDDGGEDDDD